MSEVSLTFDGHVLEIHLNRPKVKNALSLEMYRQLTDALVQFERNEALNVAVIYGDEECFCAGNDLKDFLSGGELNSEHPTIEFINLLTEIKKPLVAAVAGPAVGIGTTMLMHCDLVYCADNAVFQMPFVKLGLCPEAASSFILPRLVGHVKAFEWLVLGERFSAEDAKEAGLVNKVLASNEVIPAAKAAAQNLANLPQSAVLASKRLIKQDYQVELKSVIKNEISDFSALLKSEQSQQIIQSFFSK